jgi:LSD1 subclass zinc finger protein
LSFGDPFRGSCRGLLQAPSSASSFRFACVACGHVAVELESSLHGNAPKNPDV